MSPATVDVRSPITSSLPRPSSTPQNPDLVPEMPSPSTFNLGASNDNGSQCQFGSTVPSRPARLRPRLVKLRKQHSRSRTEPAESGPGVNPFFSVSDSTNASNGFNFSNGDCQGVGFVFGAKNGVDENLDNREGRSGGVERKLDNGEGGSNETVRTSSCDDNLDNGQGESGEIVKNLSFDEREQSNSGNGIDFDKLESASCEFGARQDNLSSSFWGEKRECGEHERGMVSEDNWDGKKETETGGLKADNLDFSFTATRSDLGLGWDLESKQETRECHGYMEKPSANNSEVKSESAGECNVCSGHGANQRESAPNSSTENGESASFVFAAGPDGLGSTSNSGNREYSEIEGKSGCDGFGPGFQPNGCVSEAASVSGAKKKDENSFTATPDGFGGCFEDFKPSFWDPSCLRANLFPELNKNSDFSMKGRSVRDRRLRKHKGKSKKPLLNKQGPGQDHVPKENSSKENLDPSGCYSPMDFSPYEETRVTDSHSKETAVASTNATVAFDPKGEDLAASGNRLDDMDDQKSKELIGENSRHRSERIFFHDGFWKGSGSGAETPCFSGIIGADMDSEKARAGMGSNIERQESDCRTPLFPSDVENMKNKYFTFLALSSVQENSTVAKRQQRRKKNKMKVGHETFVITPSPNVEFGSSDLFSTGMVDKSEADEQFKQVHISSTVATHETCEKWRIRGNEAYKNGDLPKAEDFYTQGIISIPSNERSGCSLKPLLLCYSNRAATRMSLGRIREALVDCMMATALDPNFLKGQMRAANCHLLLGEVENAREYFNKCSESRNGVCLDRRIVIDSADGLQKVQNVVECTNRSAKLLDQRTPDAALAALEIISEALSVSSYSEKLLEMKAEALCLLRRYEEAIQLCEQSLLFAERNFAPPNNVENMDFSGREVCPVVRLWRWFFISKSYFHLGRLEAALDLLERLEKLGSSKDMYASKKMESSISLAVTIRELLSHKNAGNEAFRSGRHTEAVEHYTVALSSNTASRPFSAICLCNRGAANQALGQITDAIADCSLAIALDGNYVKAVGRRATLHEMIRDYGQAASDLQRLVSILENQSNDKVKESSSKGRSNGSVKELRSAHKRLPLMEQEAKKRLPLDFYLILGVKSSDASPDIKKAYRKAALKHHPDKAGQFLARSESGDERQVWKEISLEVHKDADRLFKMIGEAYAVLSDPAKRSQYDLEEEMRKVEIESKGSSIYRKSSPNQAPGRNSYGKPDFSSPFERSSNSRNSSREYWRTYGNSYSRW